MKLVISDDGFVSAISNIDIIDFSLWNYDILIEYNSQYGILKYGGGSYFWELCGGFDSNNKITVGSRCLFSLAETAVQGAINQGAKLKVVDKIITQKMMNEVFNKNGD